MIRRLLCRFTRHAWAIPIWTGELYLTFCQRCDEPLTGGWFDMEAAGAWEHWR